MKRLVWVVLAIPLMAFWGCGVDYKADVESNLFWLADWGSGSTGGQGNKTIDLPDDSRHCCTVRNLSEWGYVRVRITVDGGWLIFGPDDSGWAESWEEYGVATACAD